MRLLLLAAIPASAEINWRDVYSQVRHSWGDVEDIPHWQMTWHEMNRIIADGVYDGVETSGTVVEKSNCMPLARTATSIVYPGDLLDDDDSSEPIVAKYVHNCWAIASNSSRSWWRVFSVQADEDELVQEYIFLKALAVPMFFGSALTHRLLVPQVFGLSPSIPLSKFDLSGYEGESGNFAYPFDDLNNKVCRESGRGAVRYMVEAQVGMDIETYWTAILKAARSPAQHLSVLKAILHMGVQLVQMLKELHGRGVLHSDIKANNIAFADATKSATELDPAVDRLVLIDFGSSEFFPKSLTSPTPWYPVVGLNLYSLSPWNLQGSPQGRRDDLYRAVAIVGNMVSNNELARRCERDYDARAWKGDLASLAPLIKRKLNPNMLSVSSLGKIKEPQKIQKVVNILNSLAEEIVTIPRFDSRPNYSLYIAKLRHALYVLS